MVKNKTLRILFIIAGSISLLLGIIGAFLPLLPTTPFVLLSAYCYAKSSARLYELLLKHKIFGRIISDYSKNRIIRKKTKIIAISFMWISLSVSLIFFMPFLWVRIIVIAIGLSVTIYLLRFPSD
jgi:uncharacterized protein